jgi:translation initiation factor IF-3
MIGIIQTKEALKMSSNKELDLVLIAPKGVPPVCKIMDYGKYLFELSKKEKEAKKNQNIVSIKEIRISPSIEDHDFNFKVKNACKFLEDGDKVKVSVKFRGREMNYTELGKVVLKKFAESCNDFGTVDRAPKLEGRSMTMILSPKA